MRDKGEMTSPCAYAEGMTGAKPGSIVKRAMKSLRRDERQSEEAAREGHGLCVLKKVSHPQCACFFKGQVRIIVPISGSL